MVKRLLKKILFKRKRLIIYDDFFPNPLSAFRYKEFIFYLENIEGVTIISSGESVKMVGNNSAQKNSIDEFEIQFPSLQGKVKPLNKWSHFKANLFYAIFLNNIYRILPILHSYNTPFIFTLYPGGGFQLNNEESDKKLRAVFSSSLFRKVIVTQRITFDYLVKNNFCPIENIEVINGSVAITPNFKIENKNNYGIDKKTLDVAFCASKYTKGGIDKGYDLFIEAAKILEKRYSFINFHVIGNFNESDHELDGLKAIEFHGSLEFKALNKVFEGIDLIISPNRKDKLAGGAFDGFPLGTCVQAAFNGAVVLATDVFGQANGLFTKDEIIIIKPDVADIIEKVEQFIRYPESLISTSKISYRKFGNLYSEEKQLKPRVNLINSHIQ